MRYEKTKYNRMVADRMFEWQSDEWIIDRNGNLKLRDELSDIEINTITISPVYSLEE
jgi:hypothetical protein